MVKYFVYLTQFYTIKYEPRIALEIQVYYEVSIYMAIFSLVGMISKTRIIIYIISFRL